MKKINNLNDLKTRKLQLQQRQIMLEHKIITTWKELKEELAPSNIVKSLLNNKVNQKEQEHKKPESFLKKLLSVIKVF